MEVSRSTTISTITPSEISARRGLSAIGSIRLGGRRFAQIFALNFIIWPFGIAAIRNLVGFGSFLVRIRVGFLHFNG
jgi:hypothetical protein